MTDDSPRSVRIDAQPGHASVRLDGVEVGPGLLGYSVQHDIHGGLPTVMLHTTAPEGVVFQGLARAVVATDRSPGEQVVEFLRSVDPAALDQAALNRADLGDGRSAVARAMLATLVEWAQGQGA